MGPELRAALDRFECYCEVMQQQFGTVQTQIAGLRNDLQGQIAGLSTKMRERFISTVEQLRNADAARSKVESRVQRLEVDLESVKDAWPNCATA